MPFGVILGPFLDDFLMFFCHVLELAGNMFLIMCAATLASSFRIFVVDETSVFN